MGFLVAGLIAAAVSWAGNRCALKIIGTRMIVVTAPLAEELAKTGAAYLTGSSIVLTHGTFGLIEGVYDAWESGLRGLEAGLVSVAGHLFYGYITSQALQQTGLLTIAVPAGYIVHLLWNFTVMKFVVTRRTNR